MVGFDESFNDNTPRELLEQMSIAAKWVRADMKLELNTNYATSKHIMKRLFIFRSNYIVFAFIGGRWISFMCIHVVFSF